MLSGSIVRLQVGNIRFRVGGNDELNVGVLRQEFEQLGPVMRDLVLLDNYAN